MARGAGELAEEELPGLIAQHKRVLDSSSSACARTSALAALASLARSLPPGSPSKQVDSLCTLVGTRCERSRSHGERAAALGCAGSLLAAIGRLSARADSFRLARSLLSAASSASDPILLAASLDATAHGLAHCPSAFKGKIDDLVATCVRSLTRALSGSDANAAELRRASLAACARAPDAATGASGSLTSTWEDLSLSLLRCAFAEVDILLETIEPAEQQRKAHRGLQGNKRIPACTFALGTTGDGSVRDVTASALTAESALMALEHQIGHGCKEPVSLPTPALVRLLRRFSAGVPPDARTNFLYYRVLDTALSTLSACFEAGGMHCERLAAATVSAASNIISLCHSSNVAIRACILRHMERIVTSLTPPTAAAAAQALAPFALSDVHSGFKRLLHANQQSEQSIMRVEELVDASCQLLAVFVRRGGGMLPVSLRERLEHCIAHAAWRTDHLRDTLRKRTHESVRRALVACLHAFGSERSQHIPLAIHLFTSAVQARTSTSRLSSDLQHSLIPSVHPGALPLSSEPVHGYALLEEKPGAPWPKAPPDFEEQQLDAPRHDVEEYARRNNGMDIEDSRTTGKRVAPESDASERHIRDGEDERKQQRTQNDLVQSERPSREIGTQDAHDQNRCATNEGAQGGAEEQHVPTPEELYGLNTREFVEAHKEREVVDREHVAGTALSDAASVREPQKKQASYAKRDSDTHNESDEDSDGPIPDIVV